MHKHALQIAQPVVRSLLLAAFSLLLLLSGERAAAQSTAFTVEAYLGAYHFDGVRQPTLNLQRGQTYTFNVNASGHPFYIKTAQSTGTSNAYNNGVTNNGVRVGTLTFAVPQDAPDTLFYQCSAHSTMTGAINITSSAAVPALQAGLPALVALLLMAAFVVLRRQHPAPQKSR